MTRFFVLVSALAAVVPMTACACTFTNDGYRAEKTLNLTFEHVAGTPLLVDTRNGRIEVVAEPNRPDVAIEAHLKCRAETQEKADERLVSMGLSVTRDTGQRLVVKPVFPDHFRGGDGASVSIRIPDANGIDLSTSNGSVVANGLGGYLAIDTSNGRIDVTDHDGSAHIDTSNGRVSVTNLSGSLWVDTSNGRLSLTDVRGSVDAETSNGSIKLSLAPDQTGPIDLDTSNGSINVDVGQAFIGTVTLDTSNGSVNVDDQTGRIRSSSGSRNRRRITVGEGGAPSRVDTSNGAIYFTIAGS